MSMPFTDGTNIALAKPTAACAVPTASVSEARGSLQTEQITLRIWYASSAVAPNAHVLLHLDVPPSERLLQPMLLQPGVLQMMKLPLRPMMLLQPGVLQMMKLPLRPMMLLQLTVPQPV